MEREPLSVLVVDDDEDFAVFAAELLVEALPSFDLRVTLTHNHGDARSRLLAGGQDLVLLDYRLGARDGLELLEDVRAQGVSTPVIFLTGFGTEEVVVKAMKAGANDYLLKTKLAIETLGPAVRHCLELHRRETEHLRARKGVYESEERFRMVFDSAPIGMTLLDGRGAIFRANAAACAMVGYSEAEVVALGFEGLTHPEDLPHSLELAGQLVRGELASYTVEKRLRARGGRLVWTKVTASALRDADGQLRFCVGMIENVTDQRQAADALRASAGMLEEAEFIASLGSWVAGVELDDPIVWSREIFRIFGLPEGSTLTVRKFFELVHPADRDGLEQARQHALQRSGSLDFEHRVERPDGEVRWVHERAVVERDEAGKPIRLHGTVQDITERHSVVAALRASEERYRRIVEGTSEGVWMYDAAFVTTFMNTRMAAMLGYTVEETLGRPIFDFTDPENRPAAEARARRQQGISERADLQLRRKDGSPLWLSVQSNALFDDTGRFEGVLALMTDVSAKRRADEERALLAAIVESSEDAIVSLNALGEITTWNRGAEQLYQYSSAEVLRAAASMLVSPACLEDHRTIVESVARGEPLRQHETTHRRKDGSTIDVALTISPLRDPAGGVVGASMIARDLTARREAESTLRRTEEQFRQAQKMEAVGRLAGGVAHDFNNLLSVVLSYANLALYDLKPGDPLRDDFIEIKTAGERATELTRQLLAFSRQQVLQPRVIDLNAILESMKSMLSRLLGEDVEMVVLPSTTLGRVRADPGQLEQVVMNLAVNARDAMPDGGTLTIETANVELDAASVAPFGGAPGSYVLLSMSDTGAGIEPAVQAHLFEPFFTTKPQGKGTGLGLATVFGIVQQSGGAITVESEPGHGAAFKVYLPRTDDVAERRISSSSPLLLRGSETILLVEDEEQVRAVACAILRRQGYRVLDTSNGGEAFLVAADFQGRIDLLLSDVVMPRMNGRKLAERLTQNRPALKVLFTSGYTDDAIVHHGVLEEGIAFLQKPFTPDALLRKVREVLDG